MPTASTGHRSDTTQHRASLTKGNGLPQRSNVTDLTSPRRGSAASSKERIELNGNVAARMPRYMRRSSSSQQIDKENNDNRTDANQNKVPSRLNVRKTSRRRSSTSGELLLQANSLTSARTDSTSSSGSSRRSSAASSLPNSPRKLSTSSAQQLKSLSPKWGTTGVKISRRNSSTSAHILSPVERLGSSFLYPEQRPKSFKYTAENYLEGSLRMSNHQSIKALEYQNKIEAQEKETIDLELSKMEDGKNHLVVLESAVKEWIEILKDIQRLSKGVPLMRSIRLTCLHMHKVFVENGGVYGASLLALRRRDLPNVSRISKVMEELRAKVEEGGQELSLVDGKFLEEVREILGCLQGTLAVTLAHYR